jgi:hypothetical protein
MSTNETQKQQIENQQPTEDNQEHLSEEEEQLDEETQHKLKNLTVDDSAFQQDTGANSKKQKTGKSGKVILKPKNRNQIKRE